MAVDGYKSGNRGGEQMVLEAKNITFQYENAVNGLRMIMIGLFKKVAVADTIALYVDNVYNHVQAFTGLPLIIATVLFAFQIYCDFSGY